MLFLSIQTDRQVDVLYSVCEMLRCTCPLVYVLSRQVDIVGMLIPRAHDLVFGAYGFEVSIGIAGVCKVVLYRCNACYKHKNVFLNYLLLIVMNKSCVQ